MVVSTEQAVHSGAFIGGAWSRGGAGTVEVRSPYSGEIVNHVAWCDADDVDRAVAAAQAAQPAWAAASAPERVRVVRRALALLRERADEVACMIATETGRTIAHARREVLASATAGRRRANAGLRRAPGESLGVVGVISSCSAPADGSSALIADVLASGGAIVWKPSEHAPTSCAIVGELFVEAGVPAGVVNIVHGSGEVGSTLAAHRDVDEIRCADVAVDGNQPAARAQLGLTPSDIADRLAAQLAAAHEHAAWIDDLAPAWRVVLADSDLDEAVEHVVRGCFDFAAQPATATERILVHAAVHDAFVAKLAERAAQLRIGDPVDEDTDLGPLFDDETLQQLIDVVDDAWTRGAVVRQFGPSSGLFHPATIITEVTPDMKVARANTYGPVAPIIKIDSADEVVEIARQCAIARCNDAG